MALDDFSQTQALSRAQLRALLDQGEGDPTERVWAAWALALRGADAGELKAAMAAEPSSGVRRHLAVILAGQGEREALATLAKSDPSLEVRAEATFRLAQVARPTDGPLHELLGFLTGGDAPVREAVLLGIQDQAPDGLWARVAALLADPVPHLRALAANRLLEAGRLFDLPSERLAAYLRAEPDVAQRRRVLDAAPGGAASLRQQLQLPPEPATSRPTRPTAATGALLVVTQPAERRPDPSALARMPLVAVLTLLIRAHEAPGAVDQPLQLALTAALLQRLDEEPLEGATRRRAADLLGWLEQAGPDAPDVTADDDLRQILRIAALKLRALLG
jgi:hypothetical protein